MVDLSRSVDILAISFKSIKFIEKRFSGIRSPVKGKPSEQAKSLIYSSY